MIRRLWPILFLVLLPLMFQAQTPTRGVSAGEYFWDTDPGLGSGTAFFASDGTFDETVEALLATGIMPPSGTGPHLFSVRIHDVDGQWGTLFTTVVEQYQLTTIHRTPQLIAAEYFWNADPGQGSGTALLALDGNLNEVVEALFENGIPMPGTSGAHLFNVRVQDFDGGWGPVFTTTVYNDPTGSTLRAPKVSLAEYFWDTDPGQGLGDPMLAFDGNFDETVEALLNTGITVPAGLGAHTFSVRVLDSDLQWTTIFTTTVYRDTLTPAVRPLHIAMAEYFWDVDPGAGAANPILAADGAFDESVEAILGNALILPSLNGPHTFNLRVKDVDGNWGALFSTTIHRDSILVGHRPMRVVAGEYFWDVDPGQGLANPMVALDGNFNETVEGLLDAGVIMPSINGAHTFNVRSRDVDGNWSALFTTQVYRDSIITQHRPAYIAQAEYFWNADPGIGLGIPMAASDGLFDELLEGLLDTAISITGLQAGPNLLSVRVQDVEGNWGPTFSMVVVTSAPTFAQDTIFGQQAFCEQVPATSVPYWIDTVGGNSYTWSIVNGTLLSGQGSDTVQVQWASTGPWIISVEGCNPQLICDTLFLEIDTLPLPNISAGPDVAICPGGNTLLSSSTLTPPLTYAWSPTTGLSSGVIANPIASPTVTTHYTLIVTDTLGCQQSDSVWVTVHPPAVANAGNDTIICAGSSAQLLATGGVSYAWSPTTGLNSATIANPIASPSANTTYTVTVTDLNGCTATDAVLVSVSNGPAVDAGPNTAICVGDTAQLNATGALTYSWTPSGTLTANNVAAPRAFPLTTTRYYVTGTDVYGCTRIDSMTVTVNPLPTVNASPDVAICVGQSTSLSATGATSYVWTPTTGLNNPNIASPVATPALTTTYQVLGTNGNGCKDTADVTVTVNPLPLVNIGPDDTVCAGDTISLLATGALTYSWTPSTGLSATNIANPTAVPPFSITYTVTGTDGNGCVASDQIELTVEICVSNAIARNLLQAEYFWDVDPGQGLAIPISAADGAFDETVEALIETGASIPITPGAHSFNVRVMDRQNQWGPIFTTLVYRDSATVGNRSIGVAMAEYFWDADPGQGAGIPMVAFDGAFGESVESALASAAVIPTNGTHRFSVRVQDAEGIWGPVFSTVVHYDSVVAQIRDVAVLMAEYFWDVDPGPGLGTPMMALDGNLDEAVEALLENPITMPSGIGAHSFHVRVRDDQTSGWSQVFTTMVFRDTNEVVTRDVKLVQAEYFWDADPGQGAGTPMLATDGALDEAVESLLNNPVLVPLAYGPHSFHVRVKDVDGSWSSVFSTMVVRDTIQTSNRDMKLVQAEYFWDTDPGQGAGTPLLALDGTIDETVEAFLNNPVNMPAIVGPHTFNVRVRDVNNNWGSIFRTIVHHDSITVGTRTLQVTQAEYFWDTDPGQGAGTPMLAFDGNLDEMVEAVFANGIQVPLPLGPHRFRVRVKDFNGVWSQVFTMMVDRDSITPTVRDIHLTQAEYYWNTDPGQGAGVPMLALDGNIDETVEKLRATINVTSLLPGPNVLAVRVKDLNNVWSPTFKIVVVIDSVLITIPEEVVGNLHFCNEISPSPQGYAIDTVGTQTYTWFVEGGTLLNGQGSDSITVQWGATGPYRVKVLVCGNGICDTTYQSILVTPNPTIVATPDTAYVCAGQSVQLVATGGVAYIWTPSIGLNDDDIPNPFASPVIPTQYIVRGTDNFGCHGYDTVFVDINSGGTVNAGPDTTICLGDSVQLNVTGGGLSYAWTPATGLSDPNIANPMASPAATTTYTVTVQTGGGCPAVDQITVYIDNLPPSITCPSPIAVANDPGQCGANAGWTSPIGTDNCPGATTAQISGPISGSFFPVGNTAIQYEVVDGQGLRDTCTFSVQVADTQAPSIICPSAITANNALGQCSATIAYSLPNVTDNCTANTPVLVAGFAAGASFPVGTTTVTYQVSDAGGNLAACSFAVTVVDIEAPVLTCPSSISVNNDPGLCSAVVSFAAPTVTDNCSGPSFTQTGGLASGATFPVGTTLQTFVATDLFGNSDTCTFAIQVNSADVHVTGNSLAILDGDLIPDLTDGTDFGIGAVLVVQSHTFEVHNQGTAPLNITAFNLTGAGASEFYLSGFTLPAVVPPGGVFTFVVNFYSATTGVHDAVVEIQTDDCDEALYDFAVRGEISCQPPTFTQCPANIIAATDANQCNRVLNYSTSLFSTPPAIPTYTFSGATTGAGSGDGSGSTFELGVTTVQVIANNGCGADTCTFTVTIQDSILPQISCPGGISINNDPGLCSAIVSYAAPVASDNCTGFVISQTAGQASGTAFPVGLTVNEFTVTDAGGNTQICSFTVYVSDVEAPTVANCPTNITVSADPNFCGAVAVWSGPNFTDNCPGLSISYNHVSGDTFGIGSHSVNYFAMDNQFQSAWCVFTITVADSIAPQIQCPSPIAVNNDLGICGAVITYANPLATDNCTGFTTSLIAGLGMGATFPVGSTTETWVVTDVAGNTDTCSFTVSVTDNEAPTAQCPVNLTVGTDPGQCQAVVNYALPVGLDNCGGTTLTQIAGLGTGGTFAIGTFVETYMVTDGGGLADTCSFTITVADLELPVVLCPANISVIKDPGQNTAVVNYSAPVVTDNCPGVSVVQSQGMVSGSAFPIGLTTNVFVATDASGNMDSCQFYVQVVDSTDLIPPTITCPGNITLAAEPNLCGATVTFAPPVGTDNLPGATTVQTSGLASGAFFPVGVTVQTFVVTDVAGNQDSCSFTITVVDQEAPNAICQPVVVYLDSTGNYTLQGSEVDNGSTDNCGIASLSLSQSQFDCSDMGGGNAPSDLFFSEYVEGNSQNKCVEIFNGTGIAVDLAAQGYAVRVYYNGATTYTDFPLSGTVANGDVYVFCQQNASVDFLSRADQTTNLAIWTGDDAVVLAKGGQILDIIGRIGEDPGSGWSDNGKLTINRTLIRKNTVLTGVSINPVLGFPTLDAEWDVQPTDYFQDLGVHSLAAAAPSSVILTVTDVNGNTDQCTANLMVRDTLAPQLVCQPLTVLLDEFGNANITPVMVATTMRDNCTLDSTFLDISQFNCNNVSGGGNTPTDLFFSEYVEGAANTKCVEIFNGTGAPVDLAAGGYAIRVYFNGATSYTEHLLTGIVANGDVFVFCHRNAQSAALLQADQVSNTALWTGDDAVELVHAGTTLDIIGRIGEDPGSGWSMSGNLTINQTLIRLPSISGGVTVNPSSGFPTLGTEWTRLAYNDVSDLGMHTFTPPPTGNSVMLTAVDNSGNQSNCSVNVTVQPNCTPRFISCPADIVLTCPLTFSVSEQVSWPTPIAEANCPSLCSLTVTQIAGPASGSFFLEGTTTTITYVATSGSHTDTCSFDVILPNCPSMRTDVTQGGAEHGSVTEEMGQAHTEAAQSGWSAEKPVEVFPNPFREAVTFRFRMQAPAEVELVITDLNGRVLRRFHADQLDAGQQHWIWDATEDSGTPVTGGIYLYRLRMGDQVEFGKVEYVR